MRWFTERPTPRNLLRAAADLLLPVRCVACGRTGENVVCAACGAACVPMIHGAHPATPPPGFPPCVASAGYSGVLRRVLLCHKERPRRELLLRLTPVLRAGLIAALPPSSADRAVLVPVPTTAAAMRRRGGDHLLPLLRGACARSGLAGVHPVRQLLRARRRRADSVGLDAATRRSNVRGAFGLRRGAGFGAGRAVVLVDDVVASGATLAEAARVLRDADFHVVGAVVLLGVR